MARDELARVLAIGVFSGSQLLSRFSRFVVERTEELKECAIGVEVFEKASDFDPRPAKRRRVADRAHDFRQSERVGTLCHMSASTIPLS
jgi:hypothetical protein